ncbi:ribosomal protein S18-alanine N-acetyltransferase [Chloroflexota bacterium]
MAKLLAVQNYTIRPMEDKDIPQVLDVDREAFPTQWPHPTYSSMKHEIRNRLAYYIVACRPNKITWETNENQSTNRTIWDKMRNLPYVLINGSFANEVLPPPSRDYIMGMAGFWLMAGEVHITTIGVRNTYRQQGVGERLLISIIDMAIPMKADIVTLEVRLSNEQAQKLYEKYGFANVGLRKKYYSDNGEDAIIMTTNPISSPSFKTHFEQLRQTYELKCGRI